MALLNRQAAITPQRAMPTVTRSSSSEITTISSETVQFYYSNAGVRTVDAGQAIGSFVVGVLTLRPIMNSEGTMQATNLDTSLSFTSTALTAEVPFPFIVGENADEISWANRLSFMSAYLTTNGQYCVDYANGIIYGRKASTQTTLTATTYKVAATSASTKTSSATITSVGDSASSTELLAANTARADVTIVNDSVAYLKIALASTASATAYSYEIAPGEDWNMIRDLGVVYTGIISGIWSADAGGNARITAI